MRPLPATFDTLFAAHPRSVGESYLAHARTAMGFGATMIVGGAACMIHGLVPALFKTTGSDTVRRLHARMGGRARDAQQAGAGLCYDI